MHHDNPAVQLVLELGLAVPGDIRKVRPLSGGVASDISMVDLGDRRICTKFALEKLRVQADWRVPVSRNRAEYAWLAFAGRVAPGCAPAILGRSDALGGFAMEMISGPDVYVWKAALLAERPDRGEAARVAGLLGTVHLASVQASFDSTPFRNMEDFDALRLEPYLRFTAGRHPDLTAELTGMADALKLADKVLVHGDVSPKNILIREGDPVLLDAECATMGDPCFDVAFCLNHLILKSIHLPGSRDQLLTALLQFWEAYRVYVCWENPAALEVRTMQLLPMLMLARVDGKSPVEYLTPIGKACVRELARYLITSRVNRFTELVQHIGLGATK